MSFFKELVFNLLIKFTFLPYDTTTLPYINHQDKVLVHFETSMSICVDCFVFKKSNSFKFGYTLNLDCKLLFLLIIGLNFIIGKIFWIIAILEVYKYVEYLVWELCS